MCKTPVRPGTIEAGPEESLGYKDKRARSVGVRQRREAAGYR